ncbi:unnamed protein product [Orchesella dallaii]|uniref:Uncharacterized protein n=1 Tax=Orchesella dallaii TaxID=48710 RepID=A0ABP1RUY8_9HEXA
MPLKFKHHEIHVCRRCNLNLLMLKKEFYEEWICSSCKSKEQLAKHLPLLDISDSLAPEDEDIKVIEDNPPRVPATELGNLRSRENGKKLVEKEAISDALAESFRNDHDETQYVVEEMSIFNSEENNTIQLVSADEVTSALA